MSNDDGPRFRKKSRRVEVALAKFYGLGEDDPWTIDEIADYLRVDPKTVSDYINNTEIGDEVEEFLAESQARTRMELVIDLKKELRQLNEMIDAKLAEKRPAVTSHRYEYVEGVISMDKEGMSVTDETPVQWRVPVPDQFEELPKVDGGLKALWREKRQLVQQIRDILGLDAPDRVESEHRETIIEAKLLKGIEQNPFPAQEIRNSAPNSINSGPEEVEVEAVADEDE